MRIVVLVFVLFGPSVAAAARIEIGPYLQDARADGVTVVWESDAAVAGEVVVELGAPDLPTPDLRSFPSPPSTHHEVRLTGLSPGRHRYHVTAGDATSESATLATAVAGGDFTFLVYGDNRDRDADHARVIAAMVPEHADLVIQTGDMTGDAGEEVLWRRFFAIEAPLLASTPMYPTLGNHELLHDAAAAHYRRYFALPFDALGLDPVGLEVAERYYAFRYANALFIGLDGNHSHDRAQAAYLVRALDAANADPSVRHVFVFFHQPPFSVGDFCGSAAEQGLWVPEFERRPRGVKVRAVLTGHEHVYERLERAGVRYFVAGGGGAPLMTEGAHCPEYDRRALRTFRSAHHFLRVRVRGGEAVLDAVAVSGEVIETVRLDEPLPGEAAPPVPFHPAPPLPTVAVAPPEAVTEANAGPSAESRWLSRSVVLPLVAVVALGWVLATVLLARRKRRHG